MSLLKALNDPKQPLSNVEWCPPQMDISLERSLDAWIDSNHFIRKVTSLERFVFMTDGSTGRREEQNLRHVIINLGNDADHSLIVPILTAKHPLEYCLEFAERAYAIGFRSLVVLGGDRSDVVPRCVEHAYQLRKMIRDRVPGLTLGGWANPHGGIKQVEFMVDPEYSADFYLAQIVSHYQTEGLDKFLDECAARDVQIPGVFGVFYYRSANPKTLNVLKTFFPVPVDELKADFDLGSGAEEICSQSIKALLRRGIKNIYVSNLPNTDVEGRLGRIEALVSNRAS
jgi:5,10-methylenetetrahydrofolate reductase